MNKSILMVATVAALMTFGCKSKREKLGDEHLAAGRLSNAISMYQKAETKDPSKLSEEFYDNYNLALIRQMDKMAQKDPTGDIIFTYWENINKSLDKIKKPEVKEEYVKNLMSIGQAKISSGDFIQAIQGFDFFETAKQITKSDNVGLAEYKATYEKAEAAVIAKALTNMGGDPVVSEYYLLEAQKLIGDHEKISSALNEIRQKNLHNFLIWSSDMNGVEPHSKIDVNGWVMAFRQGEFKKGNTSLNGFVEVWNSTGNNGKFTEPNEITLVSTDEKVIENTAPIAKACQRIDTEKDCTQKIAFSFDDSFVPAYVQIKNEFGSGRKYLPID